MSGLLLHFKLQAIAAKHKCLVNMEKTLNLQVKGEKPCLDNGSKLHQKEFRLLKDIISMGSPEGPQAIYSKLGWRYRLANKFELKK